MARWRCAADRGRQSTSFFFASVDRGARVKKGQVLGYTTEEGVTYQELVATSRREAAERLLTNATLAVGEIGYLLGFSEPSAFHRAFKRWHDSTPQEYRRSHQRP